MASLPASQRPSSGSQRSSPPSTSPTHSHASLHEERASRSDETETVLLNPSSGVQPQESSEGGLGPASKPLQRQDSVDIRRCWICYSDETEDGPMASDWRSPCPCALTAHEACLLDWVADLEVSNSGRAKKVLCPQCKSEIRIARPRSFLVDITKGIEAAAGRLVLPSILILGSSTVVYLSASYGIVAVHTIVGSEDMARIMYPNLETPSQVMRRFFGFAVVPWMLVMSRTSIADSVLPIVPMLFFVTQPRPDALGDFSNWPPSAGLSFAVLPYVRAAYNAYYEYVWGDKVRRWLEEVKPRTGSNTENDALELEIGVEDDGDDEADDDDDDEVHHLIGEEVDNHNAAPHPAVAAHPLHAPPLDQPNAPAVIRAEANIPAPANPIAQANAMNGNRVNVRRDYSISVSRVAQSVLGALAFPAVSAIMGDALRVFLPASWVTLGTGPRAKPTRFLQTRWGRCIAGGALFVVLKDAVALYVRWKMAQNHRQRKVVDYDKSKAKKRGTART
jgi:hypothetical protein